jgi:hypothetical protein
MVSIHLQSGGMTRRRRPMMKRLALVLVLAAMATITVTLLASPQATLILRSGDKVRGELVDLGGVGFTMRVNGMEQRIPADQVAVIDFTSGGVTAAEAARIQDGRAFVVLHSGSTFYGGLYDIGGNDPLRITFRTADGERDVSSAETARIYLARWTGMPSAEAAAGATTQQTGNQQPSGQQGTTGTSGSGRQGGRGQRGAGTSGNAQQSGPDQGGAGISVPANPCWTNTGIIVQQSEFVTFEGSGEIRLGEDRDDVAGVGGSKIGRYVRNAPMRGVLAGALLGRIGAGRPFGIGDQQQALQMPNDGELMLGVNDDYCGDNSGEFRVRVTTRRR